MMLVRTDENDRLHIFKMLAQYFVVDISIQGGQRILEVLARRRRERDTNDLLQLIDGTGCAGAARDDTAVRTGVNRFLDRFFGLVQKLAHAAAGDVIFGMRVRVNALQALQIRFDKPQATSRSRVIAVHHEALAKRRLKGGVNTHNLLSQKLRIKYSLCHTAIMPQLLMNTV